MHKTHINRDTHRCKGREYFWKHIQKLVIGIIYYKITGRVEYGQRKKASTFTIHSFKILDFVPISYLLLPNIVEI